MYFTKNNTNLIISDYGGYFYWEMKPATTIASKYNVSNEN